MRESQVKTMSRLLLLLLCLMVSAGMSAREPVDTKITIDFKSAAVPTVLQEIKQQSGVNFFYSDELARTWPSVTIAARQKAVSEVIEQLARLIKCSYRVSGNIITFSQQTQMGHNRRVKGVVYDDTGEPVIGAQIRVVGTKILTTTNTDGEFAFDYTGDTPRRLEVSYVGMQTQNLTIEPNMKINMVADVKQLSDVVVTGYYTQNKQTYTGVATNYSGTELAAVSDRNVLSTIASLDPSFRLTENIAMGSDPNTMPNVQVRGMNSLPNSSVTNLNAEYKGNANLPTFILDGFEVSVEKVYDLDPNKIARISILKDASATAIYGSRAANGVVVIETKSPQAGKLRLNYYGSVDMEVADLSDYHLLNAREKLQYEDMAGLYKGSDAVYVQEEYLKSYNERLKLVAQGYDTDWLAKPLKSVGISQKHTMQLEGGNDSFRYGLNLNYLMNAGVMKGSDRSRLGTSLNLLYNYRNLRFRNELSYGKITSNNSPYGPFSTYTYLNPYYYPYDASGNLKQVLFDNYTPARGSSQVANPMYNTMLNTIDQTTYDDFVDNFSVEWNIIQGLRLKGNFSLERVNRGYDNFKPADHTDFIGKTEDKGSYTKGHTLQTSYDANVVLSYFKQAGNYTLNLNAGWNIQESKSDYNAYTVYGFANQSLNHPSLGVRFKEGDHVRGYATTSRLMGFFGNANLSYADRYFIDASLRSDGSSVFGSNNRWGTFWSSGMGWNVHHEKWLKGSRVINQLRLRLSTGFTGSQNFYPYQAMMMYNYDSSLAYQDYVGAVIKAFGNRNLKWQRTQKNNLGVDFSLLNNRLSGYFNYFIENSKDLLVDVNMPSYIGFDVYKDNLGETQNKGFDFNVKAVVYRDKYTSVNLFVNGQHYTNKLKKISSGLSSYNDLADKEAGSRPYVRYQEGASINSIWVVRSAGIDPATGNEVFIKRDGSYTSTWSEKDYVPYKSTDPTMSGTFGLNAYYKGWELNANFFYRFGGYAYNQTLVDKVENVNPYLNVDRRSLYDRWSTPGKAALYKRIDDLSTTKPTSRFVEKDNLLSANSLSLAYSFGREAIRSFGAEYLKIILTANDVLRTSTIRREMGTAYPYAHHYSLAVQLTF